MSERFCKGCGVEFKYPDDGPYVHTDDCFAMWERACMSNVELAARTFVTTGRGLDGLKSALNVLDWCRATRVADKER